ncbi:MAG TPA: hypothetical protein VF530_02875, partial [Planctomycetota bacterium]
MTDELFAKLARLRRDRTAGLPPGPLHGAAPAEVEAGLEQSDPGAALERGDPRGSLPTWLTARFEAEVDEEDALPTTDRSLGPPADLTEQASERGTFAARLRAYPPDHAHGDWQLGEVRTAAPSELAWLARDPALAEVEPARCVYLDIETTGLSGGAGTIPFLVALGTFQSGAGDGGSFHLWQAFLRD